jgi:hypothetical protein
LPARLQDREEVGAVADIGDAGAAVQPDELLAVVDVAVDERIPVLAVAGVGPVDGLVHGREPRAGHRRGRTTGEQHQQAQNDEEPAADDDTARLTKDSSHGNTSLGLSAKWVSASCSLRRTSYAGSCCTGPVGELTPK